MWYPFFFLKPERQQAVVLAMVDLHQISIYTFEGALVVPLISYTSSMNITD